MMARGDGLDDLREARELAKQASSALRRGEHGEAMATAYVGMLYLGLADLAKGVLADSSVVPHGTTYERAWQRWRAETGSDL